MAAHPVVVAGIRHRIGNGETTLIWGHPWLPDNPSPLIQTVMPEELREARVAGLIDPQTSTWDPHILSDLFIPEDVNRIIMILVSPCYDDSWYWMGDPKGIYTVKNAYRRIIGDFESSPGDFDKWVKMWKLKVPPKWKTFLWRAICDILPTTTNLINKRVEIDLACPMCTLNHENVLHALVYCECSTLVWNITQLPITNIVTDSFAAWLTGAITVLTEEQTQLMVGVLYNIWRCRNAAMWKGAMLRPQSVARGAATSLLAYGSAHCRTTRAEPAPHSGPELHDNHMRCYVDAGYRQGTGEATYGIVLLSPGGSFIAAKSGRSPSCFSPLMAEALAFKEAMSWLIGRINEMSSHKFLSYLCHLRKVRPLY
ncbi:PREDICTED: uncharacterized protein LOC109152477 [Ipomoea nil]|uniref:uncharacterized protein LOC109152477 n=1 Tax=Ipomoea nil TaxID=35883 RepID=UPI000900EF6E|nr:PREDICTED: uncharacterized protein LOC109152477 [Ipomoea nil]